MLKAPTPHKARELKRRFMRLKRSFCGGDKADGYGQDNDGAQKEDFVESHRHRHRLDGDVCAADEKCRENNPKRTHGCISVSCQPQIQKYTVSYAVSSIFRTKQNRRRLKNFSRHAGPNPLR